MIINFYGNKESLDRLKNVPEDIEVVHTEEDLEKIMFRGVREKIYTTCSRIFNMMKEGDILNVYDGSGHFTITFDGKHYTTTPRRTYKELRKEHNLEKIWRGGGFCSEIKEEVDND